MGKRRFFTVRHALVFIAIELVYLAAYFAQGRILGG